MQAHKLGLKGATVFRDNCKRASILNFTNDKKEDKDVIKETSKESKSKAIPFDELLWKPKDYLPGVTNDSDITKIDLGMNYWPCSYAKNSQASSMDILEPISRKDKGPLEGRTYRKRTACVKALYITINRDENNNIFEVFTNKSVHGCSANIATITRLVSLALRSGIKTDIIIKELKENSCQACQAVIQKHPEYGCSLSCPYAIAEALEEEYKLIHKNSSKNLSNCMHVEQMFDQEQDFLPKNHIEYTETGSMKCPECHKATLIQEGKCMTCKSCGYSKCD